MSQESPTFSQGFIRPAMDMQYVFREILSALSAPGTQVALRKPGHVPLLNAASIAALLTLTITRELKANSVSIVNVLCARNFCQA